MPLTCRASAHLRPHHAVVPCDLAALQLALEAKVVQPVSGQEPRDVHGLLSHRGVDDDHRLASGVALNLDLPSRAVLPLALYLVNRWSERHLWEPVQVCL